MLSFCRETRRRSCTLRAVGVRGRVRDLLAAGASTVAERLSPHDGWTITLDYPPTSHNRPRYGYGAPPHARLAEIIGRHEVTYRENLELLATFTHDLLRISTQGESPDEPCWINNWLLGLDTASIYGFLRAWKPPRYVEVGSGNSTLVVARARADGRLSTHITSIDPAPRVEVDAKCDRVIRQPLEDVDRSIFTELGAGDLVFIDCSHRVFMNSDTTAFYLDILPELADGVRVGVHDILLPDDYLPEWDKYYFSEQYLMAAYLLAEAPWLTPLLACNYASSHSELRRILEPLWEQPTLKGLDRRGFCFWFRIDR